jgi:hypothetical protein
MQPGYALPSEDPRGKCSRAFLTLRMPRCWFSLGKEARQRRKSLRLGHGKDRVPNVFVASELRETTIKTSLEGMGRSMTFCGGRGNGGFETLRLEAPRTLWRFDAKIRLDPTWRAETQQWGQNKVVLIS